MNQNSQNIVLINNSRTAWSTKISMLFLSSLDKMHIYYFLDVGDFEILFFKKLLIILR